LAAPIIDLELLVEPEITTEVQAEELLRLALVNAGVETAPQTPARTGLFHAIEEASGHRQWPLILFASNVDGMTYQLAQLFLQGIRVQVEAGKLIAILSGERDFRDLVYGPTSQFTCANQFVIQGYDQDEFRKYFLQHSRDLKVEFESPETAASQLWQLSGGNIHTLKTLLLWLVEKRASLSGQEGYKVKDADVVSSEVIDVFSRLEGPLASLYYRTTQLVAEEPHCWNDLMTLIRNERAPLGWENHEPTQLELAGIAVREGTTSDLQFQFASPLMSSFIRRYYDDRRFGNLYSGAGEWAKAFEQYHLLDPEKTIQPSSFNERAEVRATIGALCSSLYSESTKHPNAGQCLESMKDLLATGAKYLLGFNEISFWSYDPWRRDMGWQLIGPDTFAPRDAERQEIKAALPANLKPNEQWQFAAPWNQFALVAFLPAIREDHLVAVVISELQKRAAISRERERLGTTLLYHFAEAYAHASADYALQIRLRVRDQHVSTMNSIFNALGSDVQDVGQVLVMAAKGLKELEYKRVLFSLVDPEEQRIQGFLDRNDSQPKVDLALLIDLPLRDYQADLHTLVIHDRQPLRIPDARKDGRVNPELVNLGKLQSFALVPILNPSEKALGTIHVERNDGAVPSEAEVLDLMFFGRQLAIAIEQSERVNMLQSSLDKIPEPLVIVDRSERRRYSNQPAARLLNIPEGWLKPTPDQKRFGEEVEGISADLLHQSLVSENRLVSHFVGIGNVSNYRGAALTDVITDWRGMTTGGLLHLQDFNYLHRVFAAARLIGEAQDTASAFGRMLKVAQDLLGPNNWGRLYLVDNEDTPQKLISKLSFGFSPEDERKFSEGGVVLNRDTPGGIDWLTFDLRKPVVFCWNDNLRPNEVCVTPFGLQAINVPNSAQPLEVKTNPGDFWIDFPLMTQNKILGKVCFQCDENLRPEDFELLKLLSEVIVGLFDAFLLRASLLDARERMIRVSVAEKMMATMAHNIGARLAHLPVLLSRYRMLESKYSGLSTINDHFTHALTMAFETIARAKDYFLLVGPQKSLIDLPTQIERTLSEALPANAWTLVSQERSIELPVDYHLLETALLELIQNSRKAIGDLARLKISITIETRRSDWVTILYKDNGPGIPAEISERIFEDFFSTGYGDNKGTGLGMGLVRHVIEAHGGYIIAEPSDTGAQFIITLPRPEANGAG